MGLNKAVKYPFAIANTGTSYHFQYKNSIPVSRDCHGSPRDYKAYKSLSLPKSNMVTGKYVRLTSLERSKRYCPTNESKRLAPPSPFENENLQLVTF